MSVYVGALFGTRALSPKWPWPYAEAAHLYADTDAELILFAKRIGLTLAWAQKLGTYKAHFDITRGKRVAAVSAGAIEHSAREEGLWLRQHREGKPAIDLCAASLLRKAGRRNALEGRTLNLRKGNEP